MRKLLSPTSVAVLLLFGAFLLCCLEAPAQQTTVSAVSSVDLKRYSGNWYEIARFPNSFQKQCVGNNTATFSTKRNDGEMEVLKRCMVKNGKVEQLRGETRVLNASSNAKMKVSFPKFSSNSFWIIDLDPNYQYTVVGDPNREYLWILSRKPQMDEATYQQILRRIEQMGFQPNKLIKTPQNVESLKGSVVVKQ
jgi:apolipoprotein D and lipocalin family protein